MRGIVKYNDEIAGYLFKSGDNYVFEYTVEYYESDSPPISRSFPKNRYQYVSRYLFPFFSGLLAEGPQRELQSRILKIDPKDEFNLLLNTAVNTIGAVSVIKEEGS